MYIRDFPPPVEILIKQSFPLTIEFMALACCPLKEANPQIPVMIGNTSSDELTVSGI
jgi:hypothetical protein